jgi:hypothetical protein
MPFKFIPIAAAAVPTSENGNALNNYHSTFTAKLFLAHTGLIHSMRGAEGLTPAALFWCPRRRSLTNLKSK